MIREDTSVYPGISSTVRFRPETETGSSFFVTAPMSCGSLEKGSAGPVRSPGPQNVCLSLYYNIRRSKDMAERISVLISEEEVNEKIRELADRINKDYEGKELHIICILKGGVFFACELAKRLTMPVSMDFMQVSSYGNGTTSSGIVRIKKDLDDSMEGKEVLIVEDIIDSGKTLHYLIPVLHKRNPASIRLCALLSKPERREAELDIDYLGFEIPDEFVVGYGLDYMQKYRNRPFIGMIEFGEQTE
jgi:hypoxanthine phosphoribosyltransferase